jgi:hypothetical protein
MRCNDRDDQGGLCILNLIDKHSFGKWKQRRSFHRNLGSRDETGSQGFSWKELYHFTFVRILSKRADSPKVAMSHVLLQLRKVSGHEPFIVRIYPYIGHEVENETSKIQIFCEENLWPRYVAQIRLSALYAAIFNALRLL